MFGTTRSGFLGGLAAVLLYHHVAPSPASFILGMVVGAGSIIYFLGVGYGSLLTGIADAVRTNNLPMNQLVPLCTRIFNVVRQEVQNDVRPPPKKSDVVSSDDEDASPRTRRAFEPAPQRPAPTPSTPVDNTIHPVSVSSYIARGDHVHTVGVMGINTATVN